MQKHGAERVVYQCGDLRVDLANRRLTKGDRECPLEPKAFAVLAVLLDRADELVTRDELLDAVWGHRYVTPATLNRAMTLLRRAFNDDADCPRAIRTVHGAGYRFIGSVRRIEPLRPAAPTPVIVPLPYRLPAKLERLVGREDELRRLGEMLIQHRAVSLVGAGGMGKTQCALEASRLASESYADGVWFFDLSPLERAQEWATALATALSTPVDASGDPAEVLSRTAATLADRQVLFVLDNCDRLVVELGPIVLALLRACPSLRLLATSRQRLDFLGERLMWLSPLTLPPPADEARRAPLEDIAGIAAVELLLTRVAEVQPSLALTSDNVAEIVEICRRLDGMPLALELAAAQFAMLPPAAVHARLRLHLGSLASGSAGREARHQTLQALVDWSYDLLSPQEQRLFCWLGVFHGWTLDAAEWIGHALGIEAGALVEQHSGLILKSLVVANPTLLPPRFRMLETVREFALQALRMRGEEETARHEHLAYFVQVAERSHDGIRAGEARHWVERLRHEHANVEASMQWALSMTDDSGAAIKLAGALMLYGKCHGVWTLTASWIRRALDGGAPQVSATYLRAVLGDGLLKLYIQDASIESRLAKALGLAVRLQDRWARGCASSFLALWSAHLGRIDQARSHERLATEIAESESDDWLRSLSGLARGWIALASDQPHDAVLALRPLRGVGFDPSNHMMIDMYLGLSYFRLAHLQDAARAWLDVILTSLHTPNVRSQAGVIESSSYLAIRAGRPEIAARFLGKAHDIRERTQAPLFSFWIEAHGFAESQAVALLGSAEFGRLHRLGASARDEGVVQEVTALLSEMV